MGPLSTIKVDASIEEITTITLDLAKNIFQFHGSDSNEHVVLRKKLRLDQLLPFFARQPACIMAITRRPT